MRLALTAPAIADVALVWGPLRPGPDDTARWATEVLAAELPAGARVDVHGFEARTTTTGWPYDVVVGVVVVDERVVQARLAACYRFLEYAGAALAIAPTVDVLDAARPVLLAAFATGRPDWGADGTVVCLRDLVVPRS